MNIQEQLEELKPNYTSLTAQVLQDAIEHLRSKQQGPVTTTIVKIACNKEVLNRLREQCIPEEYLKLAILNYDELVLEDQKNQNEINPIRFVLPLQMRWQPKEDVTTYELALCLPYLIRSNYSPVMPYEVDATQSHFRHFEIFNPNK